MPDSSVHRHITECALHLAPLDGGNEGLVREYCTYPDDYFSNAEEIAPYMFFLDGVQFHYLPDTPYAPLYRYWDAAGGGLRRTVPFVNENFRHAKAGFTYYLEQILRCFRLGQPEEGKKYLGCLLHMLEDSTFGVHALEGPGGTDLFALDRMLGVPGFSSNTLAKLDCRDLAAPQYAPYILGNSCGECVMRLYAAYCRAVSDSRQCCFRFILNVLEGRGAESVPLVSRMFENSVKLCADVIATVRHLFREEPPVSTSCMLTELEPHVFPVGGFGSYRFRSFERNKAYAQDGAELPLETAGERFACGISFGSHFEGKLLYWIAPEVFRSFSCAAGFHPAVPVNGELLLELVNDGSVIETFRLSAEQPACHMQLDAPCGEFGFRFRSSPAAGIIVIGDPLLDL